MSSYLLLRSNKESGPYTLSELINFGLKPYDLVWSKGKSAAWRYPSELDELKAYAPQVEEQPYDRFYKKPESEKVEKLQPVIAVQKEETEVEKEVDRLSDYLPKPSTITTPIYSAKKSVFVTMPGQANKQQPEKKWEERVEQKKAVPAPIPHYTIDQPTISIKENPGAKVKYSQPLDDIKEMYVKTLYDRKTKIARKGFWLKNLKIAAVVLGLIGLGLVAGLIIKPKNVDKPIAVENKIVPEAISPMNDSVLQVPPPGSEETGITTVTTALPIPVSKEPHSPEPVSPESISTSANKEIKPVAQVKETAILKRTDDSNQSKSTAFNPSDRNEATGERSRTVRDESLPAAEKAIMPPTVRATVNDGQVSVKSNAYKVVAFGGIRNLELTVTNNSKADLDNVVVELVYLKPSELPLRTENITFRSIAANESSMIRIPDTNRGIKVTYKILSVSSRDKGEAVANNK